jgi:copper oxidase (laccase) domain-containing protein
LGLSSPEGVFAVAHAGWRGLRAGVIESTVQAMRRLGATRVDAVLGPCVHSCCYTFGDDELSEMVSRFGPQVRSADRSGAPSLDLPALVHAAVHVAGAQIVGDAGACTSCLDGYWSWRADRSPRRQATVVWKK